MENNEMEEKVMIMEELIQGFNKRMYGVETETQAFFKSFLQQYKETLVGIADRIEKVNKRYDNSKIKQQIEALQSIVEMMPKAVTVKHRYHFGAWSKSFIISVTIAFFVTTGSLGTALHLNHENGKLKDEAFNFWFVRALYPDVSVAIKNGLKEDSKGFIERAEKAITRQQAILAAETEANEAEKAQKMAKKKLERLKAKK